MDKYLDANGFILVFEVGRNIGNDDGSEEVSVFEVRDEFSVGREVIYIVFGSR